jgi:hypothetical protein
MTNAFGASAFQMNVTAGGSGAAQAHIDLSRILVRDLNRVKQTGLPTNVFLVTGITEDGCIAVELYRDALVEWGATFEEACTLLGSTADHLSAYIEARSVVVNSDGTFSLQDRKPVTSVPVVPDATTTAPLSSNTTTSPDFIGFASTASTSSNMSAGTSIMVAILVLFGMFMVGFGFVQLRNMGEKSRSQPPVVNIELGMMVKSKTVSTKDEPTALNSVFETSMADFVPAAPVADIEFGTAAIALSHRHSAFSIVANTNGNYDESTLRRNITDWGFEPDIDVDAGMKVPVISLMRGPSFADLDVDDELPSELPTGPSPSKKKKKKSKKSAANATINVTIPTPLGMSFGHTDGGFTVTKVKPGGNSEASGKIVPGMLIVKVNGTTIAGLHKDDVATLIKASPGACTMEFDPPPSISVLETQPGGGEKKGATGDAKHSNFRHSVLDEVLKGNDPVLNIQIRAGAAAEEGLYTGVSPAVAKPKSPKKKKSSSKTAAAATTNKQANWNAMGLEKGAALARIQGQPVGSFVLRSTDKAFAALSLIKPDGSLYNRLVVEAPGGLQLIKSDTAFASLETLVKHYAGTGPPKDALPCPLRL